MDLRNLNTFIQVAELNSFTRAAEKLGLSQPTISFQIRQLEDELGVKLFDRIGHTIRLTDGGKDALSYAQRICHTAQEMLKGAEGRSQAAGLIRLAMADSLCGPLIARHFAAFRAAYPHISIKITAAGTEDLFRLLDHNEVDMVCTLDSHIYNSSYVVASEEKVGIHFVCAPQHPLAQASGLSIRSLLPYPFLLTEKGMSYRHLLDEKLAQLKLETHPVLEMGSADILCRLAASGMGVSFLPDYVTEDLVRAGSLVRLHMQDFEVELWKQLLYHRDKWVSVQMEAMIDHLSSIPLTPIR